MQNNINFLNIDYKISLVNTGMRPLVKHTQSHTTARTESLILVPTAHLTYRGERFDLSRNAHGCINRESGSQTQI